MLLRELADKRKVNGLTPHQTDRILDLIFTIKGRSRACSTLGIRTRLRAAYPYLLVAYTNLHMPNPNGLPVRSL
jgi:hypothetical protein